MYKKIRIFLWCAIIMLAAPAAKAITISRIEPSNWWVGMKNHELQLMVYGPDINTSKVALSYPGVTIKEVVKTDNPNYLFVYLNIGASAKPGLVPLHFTKGTAKLTYKYPL